MAELGISGSRRDAWHGARRLLAVRLDGMGDVMMTTPALAALRRGLAADASLTLLTAPAGAMLAPHLADVDDVMVHQASWVGGQKAPGEDDERDLLERLMARRFDAAVIFTVCTQSALPAAMLLRLAGIPLRLAHSREKPYGLLSDWVADRETPDNARHEVRRQLDLVAAVGFATPDERLRFRIDERDRQRARGRLLQAGLSHARRFAVVHVGASAPSRRYPPAYFGAAANRLAAVGDVTIVFTGTADERERIAIARSHVGAPTIVLTDLSLGELAALLQDACVLVSNNTGPVHLAAAVGTPVVDLYALTNPQHTPWAVEARVLSHDVPCRNCLSSVCLTGAHACLENIAPQRAADAALELIGVRR